MYNAVIMRQEEDNGMMLDRVIAVRNAKTIYRDGNRCIKVFNEDYSKADILNEALNQARIEDIGLNIPRIHEVTKIDGKWAIVSDYIKGKTIARLMEEQPEKAHEYLESFVDLQLDIHSKSCPLLNKLRDKLDLNIIRSGLDATTRYDLHNRLEAMSRQSCICHGDFTPTNIVIADDGSAFILDWSHATQGNPCADAARTYLSFRLDYSTEQAKYYLESFCRKSGYAKQLVFKWIPMVAASLSVRGNERERAFLLEMVEASDYE